MFNHKLQIKKYSNEEQVNQYCSGFSLVETIIAIAILSIVVVAPMTLSQRGLSASIYSRDQVTAFYLAQEAIEYVRNTRDSNNYLGRSQTNDWLDGLENCINEECGIDINANPSSQVFRCGNDVADCLLTFDPSVGVGLYGENRLGVGNGNPHPGLVDAIFKRKLTITPFAFNGDPNAGADLKAVVSWKAGRINKSITVVERIFNWYPATVN